MKRILIFDAYPSIRELLAEELAAEGNTVVPIANPESIAGLVNTFEPDLLIMDPYIRGSMKWEMFDAAKAQDPQLPILVFTQWPSPEPHPDPHFGQADACLAKSYSLDRLKGKIKEILKKTPGKRGPEPMSVRRTFLSPVKIAKEV
jgi:DNA-binding NtrC family response regulator